MSEAHGDPSLIFVVEDQAILRMEAVDLLRQLATTQCQMPGSLNGVDLAREVHRCWPEVLLLVTSGGLTLKDHDIPDDGKFIPKPYGGSTLISQVRNMIERGHSH